MYDKPLLRKSETNETKIFDQKMFYKKLVQSLKEKILRLNLIMSKLLILSKCLQLNCLQIKQLFGIASLYFELAEHFTFHISHTTSGIIS